MATALSSVALSTPQVMASLAAVQRGSRPALGAARRWIGSQFPPRREINMPNLRTNSMPEATIVKTPVYPMADGWVKIDNKEGRPYYWHAESSTSQWADPFTGIVTPPPTPPVNALEGNQILRKAVRGFVFVFCSVWLFFIIGGSPLLARLTCAEKVGGRVNSGIKQLPPR
mmetsp:Transcript_62042/g.134597  ORF Transcript_62042/g.134597 Transcript_62042/m.134597 type:complete len:171 (-) Transcript_62042:81-593(-)